MQDICDRALLEHGQTLLRAAQLPDPDAGIIRGGDKPGGGSGWKVDIRDPVQVRQPEGFILELNIKADCIIIGPA